MPNNDDKAKLKLIIASCFYEVKAYSPYVVSLISTIKALTMAGIEWDYYELSGDSYVDRAKNSLVHRFLSDPEATHLFMIDSDESWDVVGFFRIVKAAMAGAELVGGLYPCKNNWEFYGGVPMPDDGGMIRGINMAGMRLIEMWCIPGGFTCYSRKAFERAAPNLKKYKDPNLDIEFTEYFRCNIEPNGGRIGEDVYFQQRYREMGGLILCEPNVTISHFGVQSWTGNYHEHLCKLRGIDPETGQQLSGIEEVPA